MSARTDAEATNVQATSGVTPDMLRATLVERLNAVHVEIEDLSGGCGQMFEALIISPQFAKKTTLARHRLVNGVLKEEIAAIHAWTPKCYTPEEWEKRKAQA
ncbi:BolA-like protein 2 [Elsinoe fawcettii]|nr:BolA-like protein 2 [Elsinoe fawcettii]